MWKRECNAAAEWKVRKEAMIRKLGLNTFVVEGETPCRDHATHRGCWKCATLTANYWSTQHPQVLQGMNSRRGSYKECSTPTRGASDMQRSLWSAQMHNAHRVFRMCTTPAKSEQWVIWGIQTSIQTKYNFITNSIREGGNLWTRALN